MDNLKIAGYLRISVDTEKDQDSTSIENQRKIIQEYVKNNFPESQLDFYEDRDRSGYTFEQRENYQKMRPLLMNNHYDILIVKDLSRFSRRNSRGLVELEDLRDAGLRIIAVTDVIDYPRRDDWQQIQFKFLMNEMPVTDASRKVKSVIESRQNQGKWVCAVPYGYYITNTKTMDYEIDESATSVIQKIFELYLEGWGYKKIANYLTEQKIPTPRMVEKNRKDNERASRGESPTNIKASPYWAIPTIKEILVNDFYIGTLRQKKYTRTTIHGKDKLLNESEHKVFEKHHPAIIDDKTFAKVQQQMKSRTTNHYRGTKKYDTSYSGFLFCGDCGSPMFSRSNQRLAPNYICGSYHKHGLNIENGGCTSHHTRVDLLDIMVKKYIERVMLNSKSMIDELEKSVKDETKNIKDNSVSIHSLELEITNAKEQLKNNTIYRNRDLERAEKRFTPDILEKEIERIYEQYDEIEDDLRNKLNGLENQLKFIIDKNNTIVQINRISKTAIDIFKDIISKENLDKKDLSLIVDKITVYENNIEIKLKADIAMLLETGTVSKEILETSVFVGSAVNFKWDTNSNSQAQIVQMVPHQKDKAISVNVICEGDPLEIFTASDGEVIFKKYSPMGEISEFSGQYSEVLSRTSGMGVLITDRDHVISVSGLSKKDFLEKRISNALEDLMENRINFVKSNNEKPLFPIESSDLEASIAFPIIASGDISGAVIFVSDSEKKQPTETEIKLAQVAAAFLGKQMEE